MASKKSKKSSAENIGRKRGNPVQVYLYDSELADFEAICAQRKLTKSQQFRKWIVAVIAQYRSGKVDPRQAGLF